MNSTSSLLYTQLHCPSQLSAGKSEEALTDALGALGRQDVHVVSEQLKAQRRNEWYMCRLVSLYTAVLQHRSARQLADQTDAPVSERLLCPCQIMLECLLCHVSSSRRLSLLRCTPLDACKDCRLVSTRSCSLATAAELPATGSETCPLLLPLASHDSHGSHGLFSGPKLCSRSHIQMHCSKSRMFCSSSILQTQDNCMTTHALRATVHASA